MKYTTQDVCVYLTNLDQFNRNEWAVNRLLMANPWMIRGDNMTNPIGLFKDGKEIKDDFTPIDNDLIESYVVMAKSLPFSLKQLANDDLNDWKLSQLDFVDNRIYFYTVCSLNYDIGLQKLFDNVGDIVKVTYSRDYESYEVPMTEDMFDNQKIYVRYGTHSMTKKDALALI